MVMDILQPSSGFPQQQLGCNWIKVLWWDPGIRSHLRYHFRYL